jgi:hypothetical protein
LIVPQAALKAPKKQPEAAEGRLLFWAR